MSEISVGSAIGAGFQLIVRRPVSVLVWGLIRVGFVVAILAIYAPVLIGIFAEISSKAQSGAEPSQADMRQLLSHMFLIQGVGYLVQIAGLFVSSIILCAVTRSVVHPERKAFASLRIGGPELYVVVLSFAGSFALALALMIFAIPFVVLGIVLGMQHQWIALAVMIAVAALILILGLIYIAARFAFVVPMMVDDGKFHLFDAWSLTKGRVGGIILIGLCLLLIGLVLGGVVEALLIGLGAAALGMAAGGFDNLQTFFTQTRPQQIIMTLAPSLALLALLTIPLQGCATAIFFAPWARAYRDVVPPPATPPPAALAPTVPPTLPPTTPPAAPPMTAAP